MNLGLSYLAQIRDGFTRKTFQDLIAAVGSGYHTQHNTNDTHKTITATGSITERSRAVAMGGWQDQPYSATNFTVPTGSQWTVQPNNFLVFAYSLVGDTMMIAWEISGSELTVAATPQLKIAIPGHASVVRKGTGTFAYNDNGTTGTGVVQVNPDLAVDTLVLMKDLSAATNWTLSGNLSVMGQLAVNVSGI